MATQQQWQATKSHGDIDSIARTAAAMVTIVRLQ